MSRLTASRAAFDLITSFEGYRTRATLAPNGRWTLGFGHTATAREGLSVNRTQAEDLLRWDLLPVEDSVRQIALTPLSQNQFDALVSFAFNIGIENFKTSDVLKYLNQGQPIAAALSMHAWRRAPINGRVVTIDALVRRRAAEAALFLETTGARPAAPSSVIRPQIDLIVVPELETAVFAKPEPLVDVADVASLDAAQVEDVAITQPDASAPDVPPADEVAAALATAEPTLVLVPYAGEPIAPVPIEVTKIEVTKIEGSKIELAVEEPKVALTITEPGIVETPPVVTMAEAVEQDVLKQGPIIHPPVVIPSLATVAPITDIGVAALSNRGPMIPNGLSPFPDSAVYHPANGTSGPITAAANDGLKTRLHGTPELVEMPADPVSTPVKAADTGTNRFSILVWFLMILGTALLVGGLYFSWKSGLLTVTTPRREPSSGELSVLLAAASGLIILVTSAVSALTGNRDND